MNKEKIMELLGTDFLLILRLHRTMKFIVNARRDLWFKNMILDREFNDLIHMMRERDKDIEKLLSDHHPGKAKKSKKAKRKPRKSKFIKIVK